MVEEIQAPQENSITDEETLAKLLAGMKDNPNAQDEKNNVHTFLLNVVNAEDNSKIGNLRDDKDMNELGNPSYTVRGSKDMALIAGQIMNNDFFAVYFETEAQNTLATSLSRGGFLVRQASIQTKQIVDSTKRKKINKGLFKSSTEESGGDITQQNG